jgi:hypothetical protein
MSHHGPNPFDGEQGPDFQKRNALMRDLLNTAGFRGAIGAYPEGKLTPADEGNIQFAIGERDGKVVIDFGTSVHWLGMSPQQAADFASAVLAKARLVGRKSGETITMTIGG